MLYALCFMLCTQSAQSDIRVGGGANNTSTTPSYAGAYQQVNMMHQVVSENNAIDIENLPVRVADENIARDVRGGGTTYGVTLESLDKCAMIFPGGKFAWDRPNAGMRTGRGATCVAEVEMRLIHGAEDIVLARAMVAAGDSIDCNISKFPSNSYTSDAGKITFPADREPTLEDVKRAMNQEQKQNAGIKTTAGTVLGGIGGYLLNKDNPDKSAAIKSAAIGAGIGGGVTLASTQIGKQAGDTLMGAGVNAAAGGLIGNASGIGGTVLQVVDCNSDDPTIKGKKCLLGILDPGENLDNYDKFYRDGRFLVCPQNSDKPCETKQLINVVFHKNKDYNYKNSIDDGTGITLEQFRTDTVGAAAALNTNEMACIKDNKILATDLGACPDDQRWVRLKSAKGSKNPVPVAIVGWEDKLFGSTDKDWVKWLAGPNATIDMVHMRVAGNKIAEPATTRFAKTNVTLSMANFHPLYIDASSGALIDINNKARAKATTIGATGGAALGGFSAYQGASDDIQNRLVAAHNEYRDSLMKIYCATGTRVLASYNDVAFIPSIE